LRRLIVLLALVLVGTACGGGEDSADVTASSPDSTAATPTTTTTPPTTTTTPPTTTATPTTTPTTSGPVTIKTASDYNSEPIHGTFEVKEGADILGCSNGTYVDTLRPSEFDNSVDEINKVMTCSEPDTGTFTIAFVPNGYDTGPGVLNGPWRILDGFGDFVDLQGEGDYWLVPLGPKTGVETYTGDIEYTP